MLRLESREKKILLALGALLLLGLFLRFALPARDASMIQDANPEGTYPKNEGGAQEEDSGGPLPLEEVEEVIIVHITGAVANPGVYTLAEGSRVFQVVEMAGGSLDGADLERINLAQPLYDGQPVFVPSLDDREISPPDGGQSPAGHPSAAKININTAGKAQLETLPGIGSVKAQNILSYREKNGPFKSIEELINVNGIGEKILEGMRDHITIY